MDYSVSWMPLEYIIYYFILALAVASLLIHISKESPESLAQLTILSDENTSTYECGFEPFAEPQEVFFVPFFSVAILFLIFDLELVYLYPWVLNSEFEDLRSFSVICTFIAFIAFGLFLEWRSGSLNFFKAQQVSL